MGIEAWSQVWPVFTGRGSRGLGPPRAACVKWQCRLSELGAQGCRVRRAQNSNSKGTRHSGAGAAGVTCSPLCAPRRGTLCEPSSMRLWNGERGERSPRSHPGEAAGTAEGSSGAPEGEDKSAMSRGAMSSNVEHQGGMGQCTGSVPAAVGGTQSRLPGVTPEPPRPAARGHHIPSPSPSGQGQGLSVPIRIWIPGRGGSLVVAAGPLAGEGSRGRVRSQREAAQRETSSLREPHGRRASPARSARPGSWPVRVLALRRLSVQGLFLCPAHRACRTAGEAGVPCGRTGTQAPGGHVLSGVAGLVDSWSGQSRLCPRASERSSSALTCCVSRNGRVPRGRGRAFQGLPLARSVRQQLGQRQGGALASPGCASGGSELLCLSFPFSTMGEGG